jgi:hypothetical protein
MGIVDGGGLRGLRQSAFELTILTRKLVDPLCSTQSALAPSFPTAYDFLALLP